MADSILASGLEFVGRALGAWAYGTFQQLPDAPYLHSAYDDLIFTQNRFMAHKMYFRDEDIQRRIEALKENAERFNISPEMVDAFRPFIEMLMKSDSPQMRQLIREKCAPVGDLLLQLYDSATAYEFGTDRLYSSFANTYGTEAGNANAVYASNYAMNSIRGQEVDENGNRKYDAGGLSAWLNYKKTRGYNFGVAVGSDREGAISYGESFAQAWNSMSESRDFTHKNAQQIANSAYIRKLRDSSKDETDKKLLSKLYDLSVQGKLSDKSLTEALTTVEGAKAKYENIEEVKNKLGISTDASSAAIQEYAMTDVSGQIREAVRRDIANKSGYFKEFKKLAKEKNILAELSDDATEEQKKQHEKLIEQFANAVVDDYSKPQQLRKYTDITGSAVSDVSALQKSADDNYKQAGGRAGREVEQLLEEERLLRSVGQAFWDQLSPEEQRAYLDRAGGSKDDAIAMAQQYLGIETADKYAHVRMRKGDYAGAVAVSQHLKAAMSFGDKTEEDLTRIYSLVGSTIKNKDLTDVAVTATMDWIAAASNQNITLTPEQQAEVGQGFGRLTGSDKMKNMALLMSMDVNPKSELGQLKQAILSDNPTAKQQKLIDDYMSGEKSVIKALSDETHIREGDLVHRAQWVNTNLNSIGQTNRAKLTTAMYESTRRVHNKNVVNQTAVNEALNQLAKPEASRLFGRLGRKAFTKMFTDVARSGLGNEVKFLTGDITDEYIQDLEDRGLKFAAKYARQRKAYRESVEAKISKDKTAEEQQVELNNAMDLQAASALFSGIHGDERVVENQSLNAVKSGKTVSDIGKAAEYSEKNSKAPGSAANRTPEQMALPGKKTPDAEKMNDSWINPIKDMIPSFMKALGSGGGVTAKALAGALQDQDAKNALKECIKTAINEANNPPGNTPKPQSP